MHHTPSGYILPQQVFATHENWRIINRMSSMILVRSSSPGDLMRRSVSSWHPLGMQIATYDIAPSPGLTSKPPMLRATTTAPGTSGHGGRRGGGPPRDRPSYQTLRPLLMLGIRFTRL